MYNAQIGQDRFVDQLLDIDNGVFLDIGAGTGGIPTDNPAFYSNTYYLENSRNWKGLAIDYDDYWFDNAANKRTCVSICVDLMKCNINRLLEDHFCPRNIDYISIDVDDAQRKVFDEFDWDKYRFKILTLEHNLFQSLDTCTQNHTEKHKQKIRSEHNHYREVLEDQGYILICPDVSLSGYGPVEDWWCSEEIYNKGI